MDDGVLDHTGRRCRSHRMHVDDACAVVTCGVIMVACTYFLWLHQGLFITIVAANGVNHFDGRVRSRIFIKENKSNP